jgi:hypothetical protein
LIRTCARDELLPIAASVSGGNESDANQVWYPIENEGYAHSAFIRPVRTIMNEPSPDPLYDGALSVEPGIA